MTPFSFVRFALFHQGSAVRSIVVGVSAGIVLTMAFSGCTKPSSPASAKANAPVPPPPPPPPPPSSSAAEGSLAQILPNADIVIPAWAGQQPSEPFPVRQFLESRVAPADNAAPLCLAALAEISPGMYVSNPPASWPWDGKQVPEQVRKVDNAIAELCDNDKLLQGAVSEAAIESLSADSQTAIKKLDEAQQKPRCVFGAGIRIDSLLLHAHSARGFARLACIQLYHARAKGNFDEAEQAIRRTLRLSRDLRPGGALVTQLVSITMDAMVLTGIADFTLSQKGLTAKDCDRLLALLSEHERDAVSAAEEGLRMEYVMSRNTMALLQTGRMPSSPLLHVPPQVNWPAEIAACDMAFADVLALAAKPYDRAQTEGWDKREVAKVKSQNAVLTARFLCDEPCLVAFTRERARLAGVECLTAVRRYALTHGSLPDNLEVATREAGLKAVPTDPFSGGPMQYKVIDGKPVVYSVGKDQKDDGGAVDWNNGQQPGDFVFRIRE
jgi:hypothetical protein